MRSSRARVAVSAHGRRRSIELEVGERVVKVTNPDKVLFPKARTDEARPRRVLPRGRRRHRARAVRAADAAAPLPGRHRRARQIYQKRVPEKRPEWIEAARVTFPSGRHADELCVTELAQVVWAANLAVIDFHPWPSRRARHRASRTSCGSTSTRSPGTTFARREARRRARARGARPRSATSGWPKTSGNRGIHVACRIEPQLGVPGRAPLRARVRARGRAPRCPKLVTTAWWKEERGERVFIDYNQNARDRTIASAYSVRAAAGRDRVGAGHLGRAPRRRDRGLHDVDDAGALRGARRRPGRRSTTRSATCGVLLEWVERDEAEGVGEAPYPPNFPKMPGEPPRVQPSRARKTT